MACVGASARFTNPIHGGGTGPALFSGYILGKHVGNALKNDAPVEKTLLNYQEEVKSNLEKEHENFYRLKTLFQNLSDDELNIVFSTIKKDEWLRIMNLSKRNALRIIARISKKSLKLGLKITKYLKL